jgi:hypothetical protein
LKDNQPEKLSARGHSGLIFDIDSMCMQQISGRNLDAYFTDGALNSVEVAGNAESIYFDTEKPNPCEAFNQSVSSAMRIDFDAGDIKDIVLLQKPEGVWSSVGSVARRGSIICSPSGKRIWALLTAKTGRVSWFFSGG